jgi:hypothetical protein
MTWPTSVVIPIAVNARGPYASQSEFGAAPPLPAANVAAPISVPASYNAAHALSSTQESINNIGENVVQQGPSVVSGTNPFSGGSGLPASAVAVFKYS